MVPPIHLGAWSMALMLWLPFELLLLLQHCVEVRTQGSVIKNLPVFLVFLVSPAPVGVTAERTSPTQMRVSWPPPIIMQKSLPILHYTIKYSAIEKPARDRQEVLQNAKYLNATENKTIEDLYPTLSYGVAVAANTVSGRGNFSDEITVGCKY